jgi:glyoxylase-like metal-dependent hydrolase (beta-lactamase superfamily II)
MPIIHDGHFRLHKLPMGPYDNNAYIVSDPAQRECYIVDVPDNPTGILKEVGDYTVKGILITHNHFDHLVGLDHIKKATKAPIWTHEADEHSLFDKDHILRQEMSLLVGAIKLQVFHTPGHTAGSVCFLVDNHLISGDTIFPGGPGRTNSPSDFVQIVTSIKKLILRLGNDITVYPGHGNNTTISDTRKELELFERNNHSTSLCGDVQWLTAK